MRFVLKALFFLAVVAAFLPRQPGAEAAPQAAVDPAGVEMAQGDFCERRPALCQTAGESAFALKVVGGIALSQARTLIAEAAAEPKPEPEPEAPQAADTPAP